MYQLKNTIHYDLLYTVQISYTTSSNLLNYYMGGAGNKENIDRLFFTPEKNPLE